MENHFAQDTHTHIHAQRRREKNENRKTKIASKKFAQQRKWRPWFADQKNTMDECCVYFIHSTVSRGVCSICHYVCLTTPNRLGDLFCLCASALFRSACRRPRSPSNAYTHSIHMDGCARCERCPVRFETSLWSTSEIGELAFVIQVFEEIRNDKFTHFSAKIRLDSIQFNAVDIAEVGPHRMDSVEPKDMNG